MADQTRGLLSAYLQRKRIAAVVPYITGSILDFGCGTGALAPFVLPALYVGVDRDHEVLAKAAAVHDGYRFLRDEDFFKTNDRYQTIVIAAVIEHVVEPVTLLQVFYDYLNDDGRILVTTPDPRWTWAHALGSACHLFSKEAHGEHKEFIDKRTMDELAQQARLSVETYVRFLCGANQLFILKKS